MTTAADRLRHHAGVLAVAASVAGMLAPIPALPAAVRGLLLAGFVLIGPGCALLCHVELPDSALPLLIPSFGVASVVLLCWLSSYTVGLTPLLVLGVLAGVSAGVGALELVGARHRSAA